MYIFYFHCIFVLCINAIKNGTSDRSVKNYYYIIIIIIISIVIIIIIIIMIIIININITTKYFPHKQHDLLSHFQAYYHIVPNIY